MNEPKFPNQVVANADIPNLSVSKIVEERTRLLEKYNEFLGRVVADQDAPPLTKEEDARGEELWRELVRRAIADDAEALEAVTKEFPTLKGEPDPVITKQILKDLLSGRADRPWASKEN